MTVRKDRGHGLLVRGFLGIAIGALCLWLLLRGLALKEVGSALAQARPFWLGLALLSVVAVALLKSVRWWFLYPQPYRPPSWRQTFPVLMTAQMLNVLIPFRVGEVARVGLMIPEGAPAGMTLSTIVVEKSLELLAVGTLVVLILPVSVLPDWFPLSDGVSMGLAGGLLLAVLLMIWVGRVWVERLAGRILGLGGWLPESWQVAGLRVVSQVLEGLGALTSYRTALPVIFLTALSWSASVFTMGAVLVAFGLPVQWQMALVLSLAIYLSNLVPTPPALVGVVGAVTVMTLRWFAVPRPTATALGLVLNVVLVGPLVLMGGWATWWRFSMLAQGTLRERWAWSLGLRKRDSHG